MHAPSPSLWICGPHSFTTCNKLVVAVFHSGASLPNFEGSGHSYFSLTGIEYAYNTWWSGMTGTRGEY